MIKFNEPHFSAPPFHKETTFLSKKWLLANLAHRLSGKSVRRLLALLMGLPLFCGSVHGQTRHQIEALGQAYSMAQPVANGLTRLTFFRPIDDLGAKAVSVYLNQGYHTSLIKGGYSQACIKSGLVDVGLRRVEDNLLARNPILSEEIKLQSGAHLYLRVSDQSGTAMPLQTVAANQAANELAQTRLQLHTLSRAASVVPCADAPMIAAAPVQVTPIEIPSPVVIASLPAPLPAPLVPSQAATPVLEQPQVITLTADALFAYGKSGLADMSQTGRTALDNVVRRVIQEYASVDSITVLGHSDPMGRSDETRQSISERRAQTVRDYLSSHGLPTTRIFSEGRADKDLVVTNCGVTPNAANILCNRPNRRVAIQISGVRR
jgi:outer membrane protein OmpA-like peptidoglycan-associated protein